MAALPASRSRAQAPAGPQLNFCGVNLPLESGYTAVSSSEVTGPAYQLAMEREDGTLLRHKALPHGMQGYVTGCYGSLTTFNLLFANKGDQFVGQKGDD